MSEKSMKTYLTIAQVAEVTQTSTTTVRRWIAQGELRAYRFGAQYSDRSCRPRQDAQAGQPRWE
ncbi:helix-turn-helix domain-containing protein [Brevibacterium aurantiacum]|uniref:Helix-turn-helix domain-containing protein n=1 Tax=Brevibacterium aurantiacum TaxID=273384 RepID=A0A556C5A3_BREAU|nr:helix-turn-helix domain-containing protein [Brevibacterium aurantiacum]